MTFGGHLIHSAANFSSGSPRRPVIWMKSLMSCIKEYTNEFLGGFILYCNIWGIVPSGNLKCDFPEHLLVTHICCHLPKNAPKQVTEKQVGMVAMHCAVMCGCMCMCCGVHCCLFHWFWGSVFWWKCIPTWLDFALFSKVLVNAGQCRGSLSDKWLQWPLQ